MNIDVAELGLNLGNYLAQAQREPVVIEDKGHSMAVLISPELYRDLLGLENGARWAQRALEAEQSGYADIDIVMDMAGEKSVVLWRGEWGNERFMQGGHRAPFQAIP